MRHLNFILSMALFVLIGFGCSKDSAPTGISQSISGTLKLHLTDAPGNFDQVNITFSEISVQQNDWIVIEGQEQTFDLLSLTGGVTAMLGEAVLEPGTYNQIRLKITAAEVVVEGTTYPLTVPSGSRSGLKLVNPFEIESGSVTELVIDFDAARSVHKRGNNDEYILHPALRLIATKEQTGGISGQVSEPEEGLTAYAIAGIDTVTSTSVDETSGEFTLAFLPAQVYSVALTDSLDAELYSTTGVEVTAGTTTSLGTITLGSQ